MSFKARWFIKTVCFLQFMVSYRIKPENSVWFEDAKLKNLIICQPENRNRFNKIFGGFIMRQAFELAWANAFTFRFNQNLIQLLNYWHFFILVNQDLFVCTWMISCSKLLLRLETFCISTPKFVTHKTIMSRLECLQRYLIQ